MNIQPGWMFFLFATGSRAVAHAVPDAPSANQAFTENPFPTAALRPGEGLLIMVFFQRSV